MYINGHVGRVNAPGLVIETIFHVYICPMVHELPYREEPYLNNILELITEHSLWAFLNTGEIAPVTENIPGSTPHVCLSAAEWSSDREEYWTDCIRACVFLDSFNQRPLVWALLCPVIDPRRGGPDGALERG